MAQKNKGAKVGPMVKMGIFTIVALLFWLRYHYCYHPVLNRVGPHPAAQTETAAPPQPDSPTPVPDPQPTSGERPAPSPSP